VEKILQTENSTFGKTSEKTRLLNKGQGRPHCSKKSSLHTVAYSPGHVVANQGERPGSTPSRDLGKLFKLCFTLKCMSEASASSGMDGNSFLRNFLRRNTTFSTTRATVTSPNVEHRATFFAYEPLQLNCCAAQYDLSCDFLGLLCLCFLLLRANVNYFLNLKLF